MKQREPCLKSKVNTNTNTEENPKTTEQTKEKRQRSSVRPPDINKDINENKTKDITIKKQNPIKRITQTEPTPVITSNKFEEIEEMDIENKTSANKSQPKKSQKSKLNKWNNPMEHQRSKGQLLWIVTTYHKILPSNHMPPRNSAKKQHLHQHEKLLFMWRSPSAPTLHQLLRTLSLYGRWSTSGSDRGIAHFLTATRNTIEGAGGKRTNEQNEQYAWG